jgi:hypothetical protein
MWFSKGNQVRAVVTAAAGLWAATGMEAAGAPIDYQYPLYPWKRDYHQALVLKVFSSTCEIPPRHVRNVQQTMDEIIALHHLTRGMPIIVYLTGYQKDGHDHRTPELTTLGDHLMRPGIDRTPLAALRWLITEARKYNTSVSLHINLQQAIEDNPLFHQYLAEDLICRDARGSIGDELNAAGQRKARINTKLEWEKGYTQKRIDALMAMLPELAQEGTIHIDNLKGFASPHHQTTAGDILPYLKQIMYYFKTRYGVDVTSEFAFAGAKEGRGRGEDAFYGFQPWALGIKKITLPPLNLRIPAYLYSGGRNYENAVFGANEHYEPMFMPPNFDLIKETLYTKTFTLYYLSRLIRLSYDATTETGLLSGDVTSVGKLIERSKAEGAAVNAGTIRRGRDLLKDGTDTFLPALWRSSPEIVAYSKTGYAIKTWQLPPEWSDVGAVDLYEISSTGVQPLEKNRPVKDRAIRLSLAPHQALSVVPAGTDPHHNEPLRPSGSVQFVAEDRSTGGSWVAKYGAGGFETLGAEQALPADVKISYLGGVPATWSADTPDPRALQRKSAPAQRSIAQLSSPIHEAVEIAMDRATPREVAFYFVDWDRKQRQMIVDAVCTNTHHAMDTRILTKFTDGVYLRYRVTGRVQFRFTILGEDGTTFRGGDVTWSGVFFGQ